MRGAACKRLLRRAATAAVTLTTSDVGFLAAPFVLRDSVRRTLQFAMGRLFLSAPGVSMAKCRKSCAATAVCATRACKGKPDGWWELKRISGRHSLRGSSKSRQDAHAQHVHALRCRRLAPRRVTLNLKCREGSCRGPLTLERRPRCGRCAESSLAAATSGCRVPRQPLNSPRRGIGRRFAPREALVATPRAHAMALPVRLHLVLRVS